MRTTMNISRLMVVGVAVAATLAANAAQAQPSQTQTAQQQPQAQQPLMPVPRKQKPYAIYPLHMVFGMYGYFEVTPGGALVFYPVWNTMDPQVMYTIFAMMGSTSLVGRRGYYEVTYGDGGERQVQFFLPPDSKPGF